MAGASDSRGVALGWAVVLLAAVTCVAAEEEEEPASDVAVGIAATLIGAVSFQMGLFHLINHSDPDMRKYSYMVINQTVSIFCAVLVFQTCNDVVENAFLEEADMTTKFVVNWLHMLVWFVTLQVTLACVTGAVGTPPKNMEESEFKVKCYATLLAHVTGFASINAWGSLQQMDMFSSSPFMSFAVLPISFVGQFVLQRLTDLVRTRVALADGSESEFEKHWDFEVEECENEIMGLTLSFNLTQAIRFYNSGVLPGQEGGEPMATLVAHTSRQNWHLASVALLFAIFLGVMHFFSGVHEHGHGHGGEESNSDSEAEHEHHAAEQKEKEVEAGKARKQLSKAGSQVFSPISKSFNRASSQEMLESWYKSLKERAWEAALLAWAMGFAWCCFFSGQMLLARIPGMQDAMQLSISLALFISLIAFSSIRVLDLIADSQAGAQGSTNLINALKQIINSIGLLVGFAWEQTFDESVKSISSVLEWKHMAKFLLAAFCVLVVVPAWYLYILPMAITQNWEWGFLVKDLEDPEETERWQKVIKYIQKKRPSWWKDIEAKHAKKVSVRQLRDSLKLQNANEDYTKLPGGEVEALRQKMQQLMQAVALKDKELAVKTQENDHLKDSLGKQRGELKQRNEAEQRRALDLQADIGHMDTMLDRMREVENLVASCGARPEGSNGKHAPGARS